MPKRGRPRHPDILTPREWEVLGLLRGGLSNSQIAELLGISERTAKFHVSEIIGKLGVEDKEKAAAWEPDERRYWWTAIPVPLRWAVIGKIAAVTVVVVTAVGLAALAFGLLTTDRAADRVDANFQPMATQTLVRGVAYDRLEMVLEIDKPVYRPGEPVQLKLTARNISNAPLTLYFLDEQRFDFVVGCRGANIGATCLDRPLRAKEKKMEGMPGTGKTDWRFVWSWAKETAFDDTRGKLTLAPGESLTYDQPWNQITNAFSPHETPGWQLPRSGEFHSRYLASAAFLRCVARATTLDEAPIQEELACERPHIGEAVFELVP